MGLQPGPESQRGPPFSELHASVMKKLKALRRAARLNKKNESNTRDMCKMLMAELLELWRIQQTNQSNQPQSRNVNVPIYPSLHGDSMIREFFNSIVKPYQLDKNGSISSASVDSGTNSVEENMN